MGDNKISEAAPIAWVDIANWRANLQANDCFFTDFQDEDTVPVYLHPQPAELAEQQGDAPQIEQLGKLVSSILSTVSLGHQTGPYAYAGEDFGRYLREATSDCRTILRMLPTLAATGKQQVGEVQGNALVGDEMVQAFKAALSRAQLPGKPRTYFLKDSELPSILREVLAARQPGADEPVSPMAKMAAALREKAAIEHTEYSQRVQSGEWGPMPEAGTQADFCRYCEGSGWDGESRKTKCPACSGTGIPVPPAQGIDLEGE